QVGVFGRRGPYIRSRPVPTSDPFRSANGAMVATPLAFPMLSRVAVVWGVRVPMARSGGNHDNCHEIRGVTGVDRQQHGTLARGSCVGNGPMHVGGCIHRLARSLPRRPKVHLISALGVGWSTG